MKKWMFMILPWAILMAVGLLLRMPELGDRPMHADEATGARILSKRLESNHYQFDPQHFHGPMLSLTAAPIAIARGEERWAELTPATLRTGTVFAGLLCILTPLLWIRVIGSRGALLAAALITTSPLLVYYNRMFIHESWLTLFALIAAPAFFNLLLRPSPGAALLAGIPTGLMFATKETFAISLIGWSASACACYVLRLRPVPRSVTAWRTALPAYAASSLLIALLFYSKGLSQWDSAVDSIRTFFVYETTAGHDKGLFYYLDLLLRPKFAFRLWWTELFVLVVTLVPLALIRRARQEQRTAIVFLALTVAVHCLIYSLIAYKTPWLMMVPWAHACLLGGFAVPVLERCKLALPAWSILVLLALIGLAYQTRQTVIACGGVSNDARNPYAYVPTSRNAAGLTRWIEKLSAMEGVPDLSPAAVIGREYWPLPWYLRSIETIGYWDTPQARHLDYPLIFAMPGSVASCDALLDSTHIKLPRTLRTNLALMVYLRLDLWEMWNRATEP